MKKALLILLLLFSIGDVFGCLILFITDGKKVLVGNHEDWYAQDAEVTFVPGASGELGMMYFDFASEKTAQGGMNSAGLFFDGTRTPFAPYTEGEAKPDCHCYIWTKILSSCSSVEEALAVVTKYNIRELEDIHVMFADKKGNSAVVGVYDGRLQIHRKSRSYQLLTNFNLTDPSYGDEPVCTRFQTAEKMLSADSSSNIENVQAILSKTDQGPLTVYSNIYDLSAGEVYVYNHADFSKKIKLNLVQELKKGKHAVRLETLFNTK